MKPSNLTILPLYVAGVCMAVFVLTADAVNIHHPKFKPRTSEIIPGRYIVGFNTDSDSAGTFFSQSLDDFKGADVKINEHYNHDFFNGVSININTEDADIHKSALESILDRADVQYVTPVRVVPRPKVKVVKKGKKAKSLLPHSMTQVDLVHSKLKNKGKGVLVGILDSGKYIQRKGGNDLVCLLHCIQVLITDILPLAAVSVKDTKLSLVSI